MEYIKQWFNYSWSEKKVKIYSIDGNIGSGKSTLLKALRDEINDPRVYFLDEPLDVWGEIKDNSGKNILQYFYESKKDYAMAMQATALLSRFQNIEKAVKSNAQIVIMERSLSTDAKIFANALYIAGYINDIEYEIYKKWHKYFDSQHKLSGVIYIDETPETCMDRIKKRSRPGEEHIDIELLTLYHEFHQQYISQLPSDYKLLKFGDSQTVQDRVDIVKKNLLK